MCAATGRVLMPGEGFVAALVERAESEELDRVDYSAAAWDAGSRPARVFACWRGVVQSPDAKKKVLIDDAALVEIFEQLAGQTDPKRVAFRFVLALILIRKRLIVCETTRPGKGGATMLVRPKGPKVEGVPFELSEVVDPGLDEATIADVTDQLTAVMAGADPVGEPGSTVVTVGQAGEAARGGAA